MKYYQVFFCSEYEKKKGKYSIIGSDDIFDEYALKDEETFPVEMIDNIELRFDDDKEYILADRQMDYFGWRFVSEKMYKIMKPYSDTEIVEYYPVNIRHHKNQNAKYYILHFIKKIDCLDKNKTVYAGGVPYKLFVDCSKTHQKHVLNLVEGYNDTLFVSELVKQELEMANVRGCMFELRS